MVAKKAQAKRPASVSPAMRESIAAAKPTKTVSAAVKDEWDLPEPEVAEYVRTSNVPASYDPEAAPASLKRALKASYDKGKPGKDGKFNAFWMKQECRDAKQALTFIKEARKYAKAVGWTVYATQGTPVYNDADEFVKFTVDTENGRHVRYSVRPFEARKPKK